MDGILELESQEAFEKLLEHFNAASKEPVDWRNILVIPKTYDKGDARMNFGTCYGDLWPES